MTVLQSVKSPSTAVLESAKRLIDRVLSAGWVSYLLIAALQLKVIWAIWRLRDLTYGDESRYFLSAYQWANELLTNPIWSPLYTAYYGTIYWLLGEDVYAAAIMHRVIIVMLVALGVLAVLRMLLPPALALLIAAWWAILPTNFDVLYTVHLFSFVPVLAAAIIAGSGDTPWFRGSALAILLIACLARLELVVAVFAYAIICLWRETHELRSGRSNISWHQRATAYGVPLGFALAVYGIFLWRSSILLQDFTQNFYGRLTLNMCQAYSVSWHQMHHSDAGYACRSVMQTTFGQSDLTFPQMISFNSIATVQYLLWNLSLVPSGLQLALFNHAIGTKNPDFQRPDHLGSPLGLVLGIVCILVLLAGGISIWRQWKDWGANWFRSRQGLWLMLLALTCASIPIFLAIRPRPAYFYPTTLTLMAIIGTAVYALTRSRLQPYVNALALIFVGILILAVPPYYETKSSSRPLYTSYTRLAPFRKQLADPNNRIILGPDAYELVAYLRLGPSDKMLSYDTYQSRQTSETLHDFLDRERINMLYVRSDIMEELKRRAEDAQLLDNPWQFGWQKLAPTDAKNDWMLLYREPLP